jgi:hypothetical protein
MTFDDLDFQPLKYDTIFTLKKIRWGYYKGLFAVHFFDNDYGVHVLQYDPNSQPGLSLGPFAGTYELRVLKMIDNEPHVVYDTPITNDVVAQLSPEQVTHYMNLVQQL